MRSKSSIVKMMPHATSIDHNTSESSRLGTVERKKVKTLTMMVPTIMSPSTEAKRDDFGALRILRRRCRGSIFLKMRLRLSNHSIGLSQPYVRLASSTTLTSPPIFPELNSFCSWSMNSS